VTPLENIRAKIQRAEKHIRDLERARRRFLRTSPYKVVPYFHIEHGFTVFVLEVCPEIPPCIALIAGDAAHNLRSALDHIAHELFFRHPKTGTTTKSERVQFPIFDTPEAYEGAKLGTEPRGLFRLGESIKDTLDRVKPYRGGDDRLWILHKLDIFDKHHALPTSSMVVSDFGFEVDTTSVEAAFKGLIRLPSGAIPKRTVYFPAPKPFQAPKQGAILFSVAGDYETNKRVNFTFDITLGEPEPAANKPILGTLCDLAKVVEDTAASFEPLLL
jgi:hypothetical protein